MPCRAVAATGGKVRAKMIRHTTYNTKTLQYPRIYDFFVPELQACRGKTDVISSCVLSTLPFYLSIVITDGLRFSDQSPAHHAMVDLRAHNTTHY